MLKTNKKSFKKIFLDGIFTNNPVLVLVLGTCPTLAVTTSVQNGLGMGIAATIVLIFSNILISALKNVIPKKIRIPAYITIIAGLVSVVQLLVQAYFPEINSALGIFLPLIVVNCIILARAEMFASKNTILHSAADGLGTGFGFTLALVLIGSIREILGSGSFLGFQLAPDFIEPLHILAQPPGGFFIFACVMAVMHSILSKKGKTPLSGCSNCPSKKICGQNKIPAVTSQKEV